MKPEATESYQASTPTTPQAPSLEPTAPPEPSTPTTPQAPSLQPTAPPKPTRAQDGATRAMRQSTGHLIVPPNPGPTAN